MHEITGSGDEGPLSASEATERRAVEWVMTHDLAQQFHGDTDASARMAAELPSATEPATRESVDAMLVTTSLRIPLGTQRRVQAYAERHGIKPTALMRQWIEQMLAAVENDHPISLQDALRALSQLPTSTNDRQRAA